MKAKIERRGIDAKVRFDSLEPGDWFIDSLNNLCVVISDADVEGNHIEFADEEPLACTEDDSTLVTPVQVTITY